MADDQRFRLNLYPMNKGFIIQLMFLTTTHNMRTIHRLVAVALALWLGGLCCLLGCEMSVSAATVSEEQASKPTNSCPATANTACCHHAKNDGTQLVAQTVPQPQGAMSCCSLAGRSTLAVSNPQVDLSALALTGSRALLLPKPEIYPARTAGRTLMRDRGSTYLMCCVFLI